MSNNLKLLTILLFTLLLGGFLLQRGLSSFPEVPIPDANISSSPKSYVLGENKELVATASAALFRVTKVIDGDTIQVEKENQKYTVRFVGIDTPETVDPRRGVQCFGREASDENKKLVEGKFVRLEKDVSEVDRYNRLLRYVYLPLEQGGELFVNDYLIREGFAKLLTYPPDVKYNERFRQAEILARETKKGLWGKCQ